jgi:hypothetical protein
MTSKMISGPRQEGSVHRGHDHYLAGREEASHRLSVLTTWAVSLCAVHCFLTPVAGILLLPGLGLFGSPWFEWVTVAMVTLVGGIGIGIAYSAHGDGRPGRVFAIGIGLLVFTHLSLEESGALRPCLSAMPPSPAPINPRHGVRVMGLTHYRPPPRHCASRRSARKLKAS